MSKINVIVNMPTTEDGVALLRAAAARMNARIIANVLNAHPEIPHDAKLRFLRELDGRVPWAEERVEDGQRVVCQ